MTGLITTVAASSGGSFLVKPGIGLMAWTLFVFVVAMIVLRKAAWPRAWVRATRSSWCITSPPPIPA